MELTLSLLQADFATSAVDFIHRVGRTARAGQYGLVTSMYNESNRDLVAAVRRSGELDMPVVSTEAFYMNEDVLAMIQQFLLPPSLD